MTVPADIRNVTWSYADSNIYIKVPFNEAFLSKMKELIPERKWIKDKSMWEFPQHYEKTIKDLLQFYIGYDGLGFVSQCDVRIEVVRSNALIGDSTQSAIYFLGYPIAQAKSNKSKIRCIEGMEVTSGGFMAGGTPQHWKTRISNNTSFIIHRLSFPFLQQTLSYYQEVVKEGLIKYEIINKYEQDVDSKNTSLTLESDKNEKQYTSFDKFVLPPKSLTSTNHNVTQLTNDLVSFVHKCSSISELFDLHSEMLNVLKNINNKIRNLHTSR